jgi:hypothetical protein
VIAARYYTLPGPGDGCALPGIAVIAGGAEMLRDHESPPFARRLELRRPFRQSWRLHRMRIRAARWLVRRVWWAFGLVYLAAVIAMLVAR